MHLNLFLAFGNTTQDSCIFQEKRCKFNQPSENYYIKTVVIDAGHGGHDPGCSGNAALEKDVALAISLELAELIQQQHPDVRVILTRSTDVFIPLYKRAAIANQNKADLFISIHCNAAAKKSSTAQGTETYVMGLHTMEHNLNVAKRENASILLEENYEQHYDYDPNSPEGHIMLTMFQNAYLEQSVLFAEQIEKNFGRLSGRKSRGVKQAGFVVLKSTAMPSVLVEAGFLTNETEEDYLYSPEGQKSIATSILTAFSNYKKLVEQEQFEPTAFENEVAPPQKVYAKSPVFEFTSNTPSTYQAPKQRPIEKKVPATNYGNIQFRVQIAASEQPIETSLSRWKEIEYMIEITKEDGSYKYQATPFKNYDEADRAKTKLQLTGFPDAFVVAYKSGKRIPLADALRALGEY